MEKKIKICAGASAGGHMNQLLLLLEHSYQWPFQLDFYITSMPEIAKTLEKRGRTYVIGECNRNRPLDALKVIGRSLWVVLKERPDIIITTGSMPMAMFGLVGKCMGLKIVWIDSVANTRKLSMSGQIIRPFADLVLSQWPEVAVMYPGVEYVGEII